MHLESSGFLATGLSLKTALVTSRFTCDIMFVIIYINAVNRLRYLITINHMISIVNSRFIANASHHLKLSVLNVPIRDIFQVFNFYHHESGRNVLALCKCMFIIIAAIQIKEKYCDIYLIEHSVLRNI